MREFQLMKFVKIFAIPTVLEICVIVSLMLAFNWISYPLRHTTNHVIFRVYFVKFE